jgi:purine nucleosidase
MKKIHLDTDIGGDIDDICALAMLLKWPGVQISGITTNTENEGRRAGYTKYVLKVAGKENILVKSGAEVSDGFYRGTPGLPKESDYWPEPIIPSQNSIDEALDLLKSSIDQGATIIGIGAFTNLFLLDKKYPGNFETS